MKTLTELMMKIELALDLNKTNRLEGWCDVNKAQHLAALVVALRPKATVEIGVFGGRSLIPMAMAHQFIGAGCAIGIDPWAKAASLDGMEGENKEWWDKLDHEVIYAGFMNASARLRADGWIQVIRSDSDSAAFGHFGQNVPEVIDLLHIDGNHGPQAVKDVDNYATRIRPGGILVMDDIDWATDAVARVRDLKFNYLYTLGTGAVFQKTYARFKAAIAAAKQGAHHENCDALDRGPDGIVKPCNCGASKGGVL